MTLNPAYVPAYVNLADFYRSQKDDARAEAILRTAIEAVPGNADVQHALGLTLVRQQRADEALEALRQAVILNPDRARYVYVYAVALNSTGQPEEAISQLQEAHERFPHNRDILGALVAFHRDRGNQEAARTYADKLRIISH